LRRLDFFEGEKNLDANPEPVNPKFWCKARNFHNAPQKSKEPHRNHFRLASGTLIPSSSGLALVPADPASYTPWARAAGALT
jgi:hypothetical protein